MKNGIGVSLVFSKNMENIKPSSSVMSNFFFVIVLTVTFMLSKWSVSESKNEKIGPYGFNINVLSLSLNILSYNLYSVSRYL